MANALNLPRRGGVMARFFAKSLKELQNQNFKKGETCHEGGVLWQIAHLPRRGGVMATYLPRRGGVMAGSLKT